MSRTTMPRLSTLKTVIFSNRYTQKNVGLAVGINEVRLSHFMVGRKRPERFELERLARFFNTSVDKLFPEIQRRKSENEED